MSLSNAKQKRKATAKVSAAEAWRAFAAKEKVHGTYPADLAPLHAPIFRRFDIAPHCPPAYHAFVAAVGYPWARTLGLLPPRVMEAESMAIGVPGRPWTEVAAERKAGSHRYEYVMFASHDLTDCNGFAFGPDDDGQIVVWNVEDSLPESTRGTFETWLSAEIAALRRASRGDAEPLGIAPGALPATAAGGAILDGVARTAKELVLDERALIALPPAIGELKALQSLSLRENLLTTLPEELGALAQLRSLDVCKNPLIELPPALGKLRKLETLDAQYCTDLRSVPAELGALPKLTYLNLTGCTALAEVPLEIGAAKKLTMLSLRGTHVSAATVAELKRRLPNCAIYSP